MISLWCFSQYTQTDTAREMLDALEYAQRNFA